MVVDTSALLALIFEEPPGSWVAEQLQANAGDLRMSTVNLTETLIRIKDRQPDLFESIASELLAGGITFLPPTVEQARIAAEARLRFPLNLGDCFAYALAVVEQCSILALDGDFQSTGHAIVSPDSRS